MTTVLERALADWVRRDQLLDPRHGIAVLPIKLLDTNHAGRYDTDSVRRVALELAATLHVCGTIDEPWPGTYLPDSFVHVCILDVGHDGDCPWLAAHTWLDCQRDAATVQFDPIARVRRRAEDAAGILPNPFDLSGQTPREVPSV